MQVLRWINFDFLNKFDFGASCIFRVADVLWSQ